MMQKTVICHFYNEEYLLPWWCQHHRSVFDHGIMIDYHSTDRSRAIIEEYCPNWQIVTTKNEFFESASIDREVEEYERNIHGWRMALNVTEFLYGNTDHLTNIETNTQYFVGNYVFVDMEDDTKGPIELDHSIPLHQQRFWGYEDFVNNGSHHPHGGMRRMNRSLHNYSLSYPPAGGRHYAHTAQSFNDLFIFYYGWANAKDTGIQRKLQIQYKMPEWEQKMPNAHTATAQQIIDRFHLDQQPMSIDLRDSISHILEHNQRITGQEF